MKKIKKILAVIFCVIFLFISKEHNFMESNAASAGVYPYRVIYDLKDSSFENTPENIWSFAGDVSVSADNSYYGSNSLKLVSGASVRQNIDFGGGQDDPKAGQAVEAGMWVYIDSDTALMGADNEIYISMESVDKNGVSEVLAQGYVSRNTPKTWVYTKTIPVSNEGKIPDGTAYIQVNITSSYKGTVYIDFIQAGEVNALNGNPKKMAFFAYQPWHGNPVENGDDGWYNWAWNGGPEGMNHNPANILPNGQRDVASTLYPIIGAYSSVDERVLRYQMEIAKAAHIDGFMINDYGKEINRHYRKCVEMMLELAEEYDMKIALQYDAKIHFANWVPSTRNKDRGAQIQGVADDIKYILEHYATKKSYLKYNGIPVINPFGTNLLSDKEWGEIKRQVEDDGYGRFYLIADRAPALSDSHIDAAYNWIKLDDKMKPESSPAYDDVYKWAVSHNKATYHWAGRDFANRFAIGHAWAGFDDTGVGGDWGSGTPRRFAYLEDDPDGSTLMAIQNSILDTMPDWILYATFNDWNEATSIEPSVEFGYRYIQEVQKFLENFKELHPSDINLMQKITEEYLAGRFAVTGPENIMLTEGYAAASFDDFIITGKDPVTVKVSGLKAAAWNEEAQTLEIAPGLEAGRYYIYLQVGDGDGAETIFNIILTVKGAAFAETDNDNIEPEPENPVDTDSTASELPGGAPNFMMPIIAAAVFAAAAIGAVIFIKRKGDTKK